MRKHLAAASAILAASATALSTAPSTAHAQMDPASRAITYLLTQQHADGSIDGTPGETEDTVMGAAAAGYDPGTLRAASGKTVFDYLAGTATAQALSPNAGQVAKLTLAVVAGGRDPVSFAGVDLGALLSATYHALTGAYGDGATFSQSLSILALRARAVAVPADALTYLASLQNADGSWNFGSAAGPQGDTNSTAIALMALASAGEHSHDAAALTFLHGQQNSDGGFPYQSPSPFGTPSDPDSDALVLAGLVAAGEHPERTGWTRNGHTPLDNLLTMQAANGGFAFPGNPAADAFTTSEVPAGVELQPFPVPISVAGAGGPATQSGAATAALRFLLARQHADGSIDGTAGETEDTVIGTAAAGYDPSTLRAASGKTVFDYLAGTATAQVLAPNAGQVAKLTLAVVAGGRDPVSLAGVDLGALLSATYHALTGAYGDGATFTQSLSILALRARAVAVPADALTYLASLQNGDGSWNFGSAAGPQGDTNSTAIALMALSSAGDHSHDAAALTFLHGQQNSDGGFPYQSPSPFGAASDPDSDALVLQALVGTFQSPGAASWTKGGHALVSNLLSLQDAASGGFVFPGNPGADAFTTSEVPAGLERLPFGVRAAFVPGRALVTTPPAPVSTPAPAPTGGVLAAPSTGGGGYVAPTASPTAIAAGGALPATGAVLVSATLLGLVARRRRMRT